MMASLTPAAAAISRVVVPAKPFWAKRSMAVSMSWRRRSSACIRGWGGGIAAGSGVLAIQIYCKQVLTYLQAGHDTGVRSRTWSFRFRYLSGQGRRWIQRWDMADEQVRFVLERQ